ncbi:alpha/beta-hydrolase [Wolfiporia cocos MD-104 SS10]|uniref:Alpha/beta-hydrolase n=1 Tax=Wolfiporia cocos (strain MD-104) TaxID=742152 RepID=A0A2H3IW25_WOLCO|nr:alpha/beta-hydrolase [Wolfiporia cocos MD-104 SS10]
MFLVLCLPALLAFAPLAVSFGLDPGVQHLFSSKNFNAAPASPATDSAGKPNLATRLQVTSNPDTYLYCAREGDKSTSGYAHFTNSDGVEDKHLFWWLFEARKDPSNAPVVLVFGGGPGSSGMFMAFSGAGPCRLALGDDGNGTAVTAEFSWIDEVNLLAIDHPVGAGFSYGVQSSLRNSSERAAWDVDDFLQAFWAEYPELAKNDFMIESASYGGTYIPNIVNVIFSRNVAAEADPSSSRLLKMPNAVMIGNGWSDPLTIARWWLQGNYHDNPIINSTGRELAITLMPTCADAVQLAYEQPTLENRHSANILCDELLDRLWSAGYVGRNPYHATQFDVYDCFPEMGWLNDVMGDERIRKQIGVPDSVKFVYSATEAVYKPFVANGDMIQPAYKLLAPAIDAGLRVMVFNGNTDGVCPWRSNLAWMNLLKTRHQAEFRAAPDVDWPGIGWVRKAGPGAGVFTFVSINDAGHFVEWDRQEAFRKILLTWLRNETIGL